MRHLGIKWFGRNVLVCFLENAGCFETADLLLVMYPKEKLTLVKLRLFQSSVNGPSLTDTLPNCRICSTSSSKFGAWKSLESQETHQKCQACLLSCGQEQLDRYEIHRTKKDHADLHECWCFTCHMFCRMCSQCSVIHLQLMP